MSQSFIQREPLFPESISAAPWVGLSFVYDVESDELADSLRNNFPQYKTLRERKHAAVINFLQHELEKMRLKSMADAIAKTSRSHYLTQASPQQSDPRTEANDVEMSREFKIPPSPASSINSAGYRDSENYCPVAQPVTPQCLPADPTLADTSTHLVFNAFDGRLVHQKTKRKMTAEERLEYRRTRQRGACAKCKRQKGKCTHMSDPHSPTNVATGLTERFQRGISLEADANDTTSSQPLQVDRTLCPYGYIPDSYQQPTVSLQHPIRRSSNTPERSQPASMQSQWPSETTPQLGTSGYVNQSHLFKQHQSNISDPRLLSYYPGYEHTDVCLVDSMDPFQSDCDNQGGPTFMKSPSIFIQGPDPEASCSSNYDFSNQWDQSYREDSGIT